MSSRELLKAIRHRGSLVVERVWTTGFRLLGRAVSTYAEIAPVPHSSTVLVVSPHPDDEVIACSGTVCLHVASGARVILAIATDGRQSRQAPTSEAMAQVRRREAERASQILKVDRLEWFGLREGEWQDAELQDCLFGLIGRIRPEVIYAPSRVDFHPEHLRVARALALALGRIDRELREQILVRVYQVQVPLGNMLVNRVVDISGVLDASNAALDAYVSQTGSIEFLRRLRSYNALRYRSVGTVEQFWELSAGRYISLHSGSVSEWLGKFRGLRRFAWTDPLAFLRGSRERARIHSLAETPA